MRIDIKAALLPDNAKIWAFHAGRNKKYFSQIEVGGGIFLDYPGLRASSRMLEDDHLIKQHVLMSKAIQKYYSKQELNEPSRRSNDYDVSRSNSYLYSDVANIKRFYDDMKKGDIVLVPPRGQYNRILAGILGSEGSIKETITLKNYPRDPFPYRRVHWLSPSFAKRDLSTELSKRLENPHAVIPVHREPFGVEVFSHVFLSFMSREASGADVVCPGYRGRNPLETLETQQIIAFLIALYGLHERDELNEISDKSFSQIISEYYSEEDIVDFEQSFHSPGFYRVVGRRSLGVFVAAGLALLISGKFNTANVEALQIENSSEYKNQRSEEELKKIIKTIVKSVSNETSKEANDKGQKAKDNVGAVSSSETK
jgi:predicted Mrr-cat superfamily restriction endonuclease